MDKKARILLVAPISEYKDYVLPAWIRYIKSLEKSYNAGMVSLDILLCDNSQNANYHKQLSRKFKINILHVNPMFKNSREFISDSRNRLRGYFLQGNYTHFLSLECDIFPHPNFITELLARRKKIVSFPYFIGQGPESGPMLNIVDPFRENPCSTRNISVDEFFTYSGKFIPVFNPGLGCTLIHRSIIRKIPFRWDPVILYHDDSFFAEDIYKAGINWYCDFTHFTRHLNQPWNYFPKNKY